MDLYREFKNIIVDRKGHDNDSHMKTIKIIGIIEPNKSYRIFSNGLYETIPYKKQSDNSSVPLIIPQSVMIDNILARWHKETTDGNYDSNILGKNGTLVLDEIELTIPKIETTSTNLAFYNARLFHINDVIKFDTSKKMPVTIMNIGENYVNSFLMNNEKGGGCYLEYHDTPHFHMPLNKNSKGYLILGRNIDFNCYLSAFEIPYGYAIYTSPYTIHCDAYLIGDYLVVYTMAENYSTVLLKTNINNPIKIKVI